MVAQLFLVVHDAEVVVVAGAEHALRHNLVLALSTFDDPYRPPAWLEPVARDVSRVD